MMRPVLSESEYRALHGMERQVNLVRACRMGSEEAKRKLVQMNYSCVPESGTTNLTNLTNGCGPLKGCTTPSNSVGMDVDLRREDFANDADYQQAMREIPEKVLSKKDELGLLMLERSVRKGYHIVFKRRAELSQEENLRWASQLLGVAYDEAAKDITRVFFTTTDAPEDLLFLNSELFKNSEECGVKSEEYSASPNLSRDGANNSSLHTLHSSLSYDGIPYRNIVIALEDQLGGVPAHGSRNQFIFSMACHLRYVCNDDPQWIASVLPTYGEAEDKWLATIQSACRRSQNKMTPKLLLRAIERARAEAELTTPSPYTGEGQGSGSGLGSGSDLPPTMPKKLPPLIKLLISKTPKIYQPAVAHAVFPALAAHLWHTRFKYIDNVEHEATLMNVLMAGTGAGKNCIAAPIDCILKDIRERDRISLEKEQQWKEEMQTKGANKDKKKRPEGIIIQEVDADMTNAAFVLRLAEAEEHFLYVRMNEIDQFDALKTSARSKSQFQIMCLAFDPGNTYGQTRVGAQSVSARVCIRFNWNASTTVQKGQQYFRSVLTDGPISRINFCTIPEQPIGSEMPVYGKYDADFDSQLRPFIDRLCAARGLIECPQVTKLAQKLMEENADFARLSQSRTYENLSFRANVIGFLKAMVLYVAHGEQWDKTMEDFIRWSEQYDLWCKMHFFGAAIDEANDMGNRHQRGPHSLLEDLPERFTLEEVISVRRKQNLPAENTATMISVWKTRGYIAETDEPNVWKKAR